MKSVDDSNIPRLNAFFHQCDQIWRNFATLAKFYKCLANFWKVYLTFASILNLFGHILMKLGKFWLLQMAKFGKLSQVIWSHCPSSSRKKKRQRKKERNPFKLENLQERLSHVLLKHKNRLSLPPPSLCLQNPMEMSGHFSRIFLSYFAFFILHSNFCGGELARASAPTLLQSCHFYLFLLPQK